MRIVVTRASVIPVRRCRCYFWTNSTSPSLVVLRVARDLPLRARLKETACYRYLYGALGVRSTDGATGSPRLFRSPDHGTPLRCICKRGGFDRKRFSPGPSALCRGCGRRTARTPQMGSAPQTPALPIYWEPRQLRWDGLFPDSDFLRGYTLAVSSVMFEIARILFLFNFFLG